MGDAKRRKGKKSLGFSQNPADQELVFPQLKDIPLTKGQASWLYLWTTRGAWVGIAILALIWVTVRFIGPFFGWWQITPLE